MFLFRAASTNQRARIHRGSFENHEQSTSLGQPWRWLPPKREIRIAAAFMQFREVKLNNLSRPTDVRRREGW